MANEVALQPSRLPIAPAIAKEYDLSPASWRVLVEQTFPAAKTVEAVLMALAYCHARKLDIFKRPVHIVPMWSPQKGDYIETVWEGIASIRTTASRTGEYAGIDAVEFGPVVEHTFKGEAYDYKAKRMEPIQKDVVFPEWASVVVYRIIKGVKCAFHAKVHWREMYATMGKSGVPNEMWTKRPFGQIDKCVEAAALRKAFPEELGNTYISDEMEGRTIDAEAGPVAEVKPRLAPPKPPAKEETKQIEAEPEKTKAEPKKTPPKPPTAKKEPEPEEEGEAEGEAEQAETPGDMLSMLDEALSAATTVEEVEQIYDESDIEAALQSHQNGDQFAGVALGIKRRHMKRVA